MDLAKELESLFPALAEQVTRPELLMLPEGRRGELTRLPHTHVGPDYDEFVRSTTRAKLQRIMKGRRLGRHKGRPLIGGSFAVPKDEKEDRSISDFPVNQLLDEDKLPRPVFAYIPRLRSLKTRKGRVLRISKRDARHDFHRLRIGKRWRKWLAHPVLRANPSLAPVHCAVPMGFGPAAGFAQGLTDVVTDRAALPEDRRVVPSREAPETLPVWGSIIDDIWALEETDAKEPEAIGPNWMRLVE